MPAPASADILGIAVASSTSHTQVGVSDSAGWIKYYIPLNSSTSGTYGVDLPGPGTKLAGTIVDTGDGGSWLNMFIKFAPLPTDEVTSAKLRFEFKDLDLKYVNDPTGFFETVQLFNSTSTRSFTPQLTKAAASQTAGYSGTGANRIDWDLSWTPGQTNAPVYLDVWGAGLVPYVDGQSAFWVKLKFTVPDGVPYGTNTPEYLKATLKTTTVPRRVPEPTSLMLTGIGFAALALRRRDASWSCL